MTRHEPFNRKENCRWTTTYRRPWSSFLSANKNMPSPLFYRVTLRWWRSKYLFLLFLETSFNLAKDIHPSRIHRAWSSTYLEIRAQKHRVMFFWTTQSESCSFSIKRKGPRSSTSDTVCSKSLRPVVIHFALLSPLP